MRPRFGLTATAYCAGTMGVVVLFDIDGTLISTGGAGRAAMTAAFQRLFGTGESVSPFKDFSFEGRTDRAIVREGLCRLNLAVTPSRISSLIAVYLEQLAANVGRSGVTLHPGAVSLIDQTHSAQFAVGLGTGNVREGADIKLNAVGLRERFAFGGFGCDSEDRAELLAWGARRGAEQLRCPLASCRVLVIGDTPRDIAAAKDIGAEVLAVATGPYSLDELSAHGPDYVVATLADATCAAVIGAMRGAHA